MQSAACKQDAQQWDRVIGKVGNNGCIDGWPDTRWFVERPLEGVINKVAYAFLRATDNGAGRSEATRIHNGRTRKGCRNWRANQTCMANVDVNDDDIDCGLVYVRAGERATLRTWLRENTLIYITHHKNCLVYFNCKIFYVSRIYKPVACNYVLIKC